MSTPPLSFIDPHLALPSYSGQLDLVAAYFKNFESLAAAENWDEILTHGTKALEHARLGKRIQDEAKISSQLTSTAFYKGDYELALKHVLRSIELSKSFEDPGPYIRALYLESAVYRALAQKAKSNDEQQALFHKAVEIGENALHLCNEKHARHSDLLGKVYFNLGAAHADNPKGNLEKAAECYTKADRCFKEANAAQDFIRTSLRLGKVHLLQKNYTQSQKIIDEARLHISLERIAMQADYLEAQLKIAINEPDAARKIAQTGLARAQALKAQYDEVRLKELLDSIRS